MSAAAVTRTCVLYVKAGIEQRSAWFTNAERARKALAIIRKRYGASVLYRD